MISIKEDKSSPATTLKPGTAEYFYAQPGGGEAVADNLLKTSPYSYNAGPEVYDDCKYIKYVGDYKCGTEYRCVDNFKKTTWKYTESNGVCGN